MTRTYWLKSLKRGDKIWIAFTPVGTFLGSLTQKDIFDGWFDFKGSKGEYCLLASEYDGAIQFPKAKIFPSKKEALLYVIPIVYRKISKEIDALNKAQTKILDTYHKLLEIEF